ncbi:MAG: DJ-1/PfpI family protein [Treponema sp.]|nr:DJ-1/PfpI family protein [Treponema sp.]
MAKAAVFFADGFEDIEALSPVDYMRRAGIEVITVGVKGTPFNKSMIVTSSHKVPVITDMSFYDFLKEYADELPDCVVCPGGGLGAQNLSENAELLAYLEKCSNNGKLVAALCASPAVVLGKTNILKDKNWTCYPGMQDNAKVEYQNKYSDQVFITDGKLVTGRGPGASEQFAMELVRILAGQETWQKIHDGSCQR